MASPNPSPLTLHRVVQLWRATNRLHSEITTAWAAHTLGRMGGGPMLSVSELGVKPQEVVLGQTESADRGLIIDSGMWSVPVISR